MSENNFKYQAGDKVIYRSGGTKLEGIIKYVDDGDSIAPYRIGVMNLRESDIIRLAKKKPGRPKKVKNESNAKLEKLVHEEIFDQEMSVNQKYEALKKTITMTEFNALVTLVTMDKSKMQGLMNDSMKQIADSCGLKG